MNTQKVTEKLESMKGKTFEYARERHVVISYEIDALDEDFIIKTDKNSFSRKFESAPDFFKYWREVKPGSLPVIPASAGQQGLDMPAGTTTDPSLFQSEVNLANELIAILKDNIIQVKSNPMYIPQANSINNNINSILLVQKLKLDIMKEMKKE